MSGLAGGGGAALPVTGGLWAERRSPRRFPRRFPCHFPRRAGLFLDRDGVINADHGYVGRPEDVTLMPASATLIRAANQAGVAVVVVTNQSGVGRGYYDWQGFAATMAEIHARLADHGAEIDAVYACAWHPQAAPPLRAEAHPMQKPRPGMILAGLRELGLDAGASLMVGDSWRDMAAGAAAGLAGGAYVGETAPAPPAQLAGFPVACYALDAPALQADVAGFFAEGLGGETGRATGRPPRPWTPRAPG